MDSMNKSIQISLQHELEQAHAFLDQHEIDRVDLESLIVLSLTGRIQRLIAKLNGDDSTIYETDSC